MFAAIALLTALPAAPQKGTGAEPMDSFTAAYDGDLGPDFHDPDYPRQLHDGILRGPGKSLRARGLQIFYPENRGIGQKYGLGGGSLRSCYVMYPALKDGDVIPAFGRLYRVGAVSQAKKRTDPVPFKWVGKDFAGSKVALADESFAVPLDAQKKSPAQFFLHTLHVMAIEPGKDKAPASATLVVDMSFQPPPAALTVRAGDVLMLDDQVTRRDGIIGGQPPAEQPRPDAGHRVLNVVPPDAETGVIGWVELDPAPLTAAQIKANGLADRVIESKRPPAK